MPRWAPPLLAVQLLTRLPVPPLARLSSAQVVDGMARATGWLPLAGTAIGCVTAATFAAGCLAWPPAIAALVALAVETLLTGAFHEDAVADFCDAFGGSATGDEARRILKDSRIGSYGALGLGLVVALRWAAIVALSPAIAIVAIVAAATVGRWWAVILMVLAPPRGDAGGIASGIGAPPWSTLLLASLLALPGLVPLLLARPLSVLGAALAGLVFLPWLAGLLRRRIGGSTGDCLGFAAYIGQLAVLLAAATR